VIVAEIWFYHLERKTLDDVLPALLERTLERGWRAVVQSGSPERLEAIDNLLWTYSDESFLPHGTRRDGNGALQPIYLTEDGQNPNGANVRFFVEGADMMLAEADIGAYERLIYIFDGRDDEAVARARETWKWARDSGQTATYWRQTETGGWQKQG
jgi:DNA polymerase-3 subunit chi